MVLKWKITGSAQKFYTPLECLNCEDRTQCIECDFADDLEVDLK